MAPCRSSSLAGRLSRRLFLVRYSYRRHRWAVVAAGMSQSAARLETFSPSKPPRSSRRHRRNPRSPPDEVAFVSPSGRLADPVSADVVSSASSPQATADRGTAELSPSDAHRKFALSALLVQCITQKLRAGFALKRTNRWKRISLIAGEKSNTHGALQFVKLL